MINWWVRSSVVLLFLGWIGVLVVAIPPLVYMQLRKKGANLWQALFLAATSCLLVSTLLLSRGP